MRSDQRVLLQNQQEHRAALASQDVTLRDIYTLVERTLRSAAREQRLGRSMRFDELRAVQMHLPPIPFPRATVHVERSASTADVSAISTDIAHAGGADTDGTRMTVCQDHLRCNPY